MPIESGRSAAAAASLVLLLPTDQRVAWRWLPVLASALVGCGLATAAAPDVIKMEVDATQVARRLVHTRLDLAVQPGTLRLVYPKWIPGEHGPSGPVGTLAGLKIEAGGADVAWRRDLMDMHAFVCEIPTGSQRATVDFDYLAPGSSDSATTSTARLAVLEWNRMLLAPAGPVEKLRYELTLRVPDGWSVGGSLPIAQRGKDTVRFEPVSLERLIDSPVVIGKHHRQVDITPAGGPPHFIEMVAESPEALAISPEQIEAHRRLAAEALALFGVAHYERYHFLLTLGDYTGISGLEHFDCSDNRVRERYFLDDVFARVGDDLLPHELVHSWCGKRRRPASLTADDYQQTLTTELLWVYEGLTDYLGGVLATRAGLFTPENYRERMAAFHAQLSAPGRLSRPLADTAEAAQIDSPLGRHWWGMHQNYRYYEEGDLLWLEVDCLIRSKSGGARSIDDFCRAFFGGESRPHEVSPFTYDDLVAALNTVQPHDWRALFEQRLRSRTPEPPPGLAASGWKLTWTASPTVWIEGEDEIRSRVDLRYSLGLLLSEEGEVTDCWPGSPAFKAGLGPGMSILAVNERRFTPGRLRTAIDTAREAGSLRLLVENYDAFTTHEVRYAGGQRYPDLERDESKPDLLSAILTPRLGGAGIPVTGQK